MTPSDLHTLVGKWPEVVPVGLSHNEHGWYVWRDEESVQFACPVDEEAAADLICGQVKRMLGDHDCYRAGDWYAKKDGKHECHCAPTELEAVLAAYGASRK